MKTSAIAVLTLAAALASTPAHAAETQAQMRKEAKISMEQAKAIALKKAPGNVKSSELEREHGKLIYSFDIVARNGVTEVNVDAITGAIVTTQHESAAKEAAEKKQEAKEKKH
jgi:uncharacterized membrane protein YkoI